MLSNGPIVINELHVDPDVKTEPVEYIELYNAGQSTVNLSGWYFSKGVDYTFPSGAQLQANQYLVVSENPSAVLTKFGVSSLGPFSGKLSNEGETVTLCDSSGTVQDEVAYGMGFPWPTVGDSPGNSMELINPGLDNNLGGSWRSSISVPVTRQTIFGLNSTWRYFKGTAEPSTTQGLWRQRTGFSDSAWLQGQAAIGYGNDADEQGWIKTTLGDMNGGYSSVYFRKTFNVSNLSALTSLLLETRYDDGINVWINGHYVANANVTAENLAYNATASSAIEAEELVPFTINDPASYLVASGNVISVQLLNCAKSDVDAFFDCQLTAIYVTRAGVTPGARNSVYAANAPPQIRQVDNSPNQPVAGQNVVITAKVTDPDGVAGVQLKYQSVYPGDYIAIDDNRFNDPAQWNTATMYDDGTHGDATAADGIYTAVLPGTLQTNRLLVRYRISATDSLGASITTPYADDPQPNFAYYVYNGIPDWTAAIQPGVTAPVTYPSTLLDDLPALQLLTTKTAHDDSQHIPNSTTAAYSGSDYLWYGTLIYNGVVYDDISYRARGGVWRYAMGKNMWKFDFNRGHEFQPLDNYGQPYGVTWKKLNLGAIIQQGNYWHRGEQGLFESVGFELFNLAGVPAENTSFVQLRIVENTSETGSNQYSTDFQGMYLMVEQPDGNFLDEHDLPDGNLYKMESGTGTSNNQGPTQVSDGSDLASFLNTYNTTTPTAQWWSDNLDLNEYYSYRAIVEGIHQYDIGDGKNYLYYHNPDTNKWEVIPWDLDLTWANNMYGSGNEPFLSRVLASSQTTFDQDYRNRMREIRDLLYNPEQTGMLIDEMASFIYTPGQLSWVDADCAMWDYNPIMTSSYVNSSKAGAGLYYSDGAGDLPSHNFAGMIQLMKNYINSRGAWIDSTILTDNAQIPNKPTAAYVGQSGYPLDQLSFNASAYSSPIGSAAAAMEWRIAKVTDTSSPNYDPSKPRDYEITALWESGEMPVSTNAVVIPGNALEIGATYRVRVRFKDAAGHWSHWSDAVQFVAAAPAVPLNNYLRITEIMYNPPALTAAEIAAGYTDNNSFEYVELTNTGSTNLQLSGVKFTKGVTFTFGNVTLQPGQRVLAVKDVAAFTFRYGSGYNIAGTYSGKFDNSGEEVKLESASGVIQDFTYDDNDPWPGRADGKGSSLEAVDTAGNYDDPENWRSSSEYGGSPGRAGIGPIADVVVNEVLSFEDYPLSDSIELYNTTNVAVNISGWYLSDSSDDYKKYRIPDGTVLAPYEYRVFTEEQFGVYFGLSSTGDDVWLMQADATGNLTYFADHVDFGAAKKGESFGRWPNGTGELYPMKNRTLGQANDAGGNSPRIGPLIISEVMYHPNVSAGQNPDDYEYIEIYNPTDAAVDLSHWLISQGVDFAFSAGTSIAAHQALLVLPFDPSDPLNESKLTNFKNKYNIGSSIKLVGGFSGQLADEGETVRLLEADGVLEDEVRYDDVSPWPTAADGGGSSLQRISVADWGDDAASWIAAAPTPGTAHVSAVVGRNIFYNNSKFDSASDDNAIAADKEALLPGHAATFANYTSYSRGINGIIIDILYPTNPGGINAADFQFKVGNGGAWTTVPAPSDILVRQGKGAGGSDRVTITWDDNVIQNQWLQVTVLADANTGLAANDVFYFGNAMGESGDNPVNAVVDLQDEIGSRTHKTGFTAAAITNQYDYNRDGKVNATDDLIARHNRTDGVGADPLHLISALSAAPPSGEVLQPLSAAANTETSQPATTAAEIATSQLVTLSEDKTTSQSALAEADITTTQLEISSAAAEITPTSMASMPTQDQLSNQIISFPRATHTSFPRSSVAAQFPIASYPLDATGNSNLFSTIYNAEASNNWVPRLERGNQNATLERGKRTTTQNSNAAHNYSGLLQDRLHDAVFARSIAILSLTAENVLPEDSSAPADIETILNDRPSLKSDKSLNSAIDAILAATLR